MEAYRIKLKERIELLFANFEIDTEATEKLQENIETDIDTIMDEVEADAKEALVYMDDISSLGDAKDKLTEVVNLLY